MNINQALKSMGIGSGISPIKLRDLKHDAAYYRALADVSGRVTGASDYFYDIFENDETSHSAGILDTTKTTFKQVVPSGTTDISTKVASISGFQKGQEITVFDDVNFERPTITRAETAIEDVVIDRTAPIAVVGSVYGARATARPQRLSNGWIICACMSGTASTGIYVYVSKDKGVTWDKICSVSNMRGYFGMCAYGTVVYIMDSPSDVSGGISFVKFDATTISMGADLASTKITVDSGQTDTAGGSCCSIAVSSTGVLTAAWVSKNSTYPNSFNIRSVKSVNGGATWTKQDGTAGVDQITIYNNSGYDNNKPYIIYKNNELPSIIYEFASSANYYIAIYNWSGTSWVTATIAPSDSYIKQSPTVTLQKYGTNAGRIWATWHGWDSTENSAYNIRISYSDDNGITWSAMTKLTSGNSYHQMYPIVASDDDGNIYILWQGRTAASPSHYNIRQIMWDGNTWGSIIEITSQNVAEIISPSTCDNYYSFEQPLTIWSDGQSSSVKFRGKWTEQVSVPHLEITALQNNYKQYAVVCRSSVDIDTVAHKMKFSSGFMSSTAYDRSTPVNVVLGTYDISGAGGRKLVRLDNSWLVSLIFISSTLGYVFSVSKDNGVTWRQLCYTDIGDVYINGGSIAAYGNIVHALIPYNNDRVWHISFDATTVSNVNLTNVHVVEQAQTSLGFTSLTIDSNGILHAAWASKNSSYPNSFNIRYCKSSNGGATWDIPTQVTITNNASYPNAYINPCIIIAKDNTPRIITQTYITNYTIDCFKQSPTWGAVTIFNGTYSGNPYIQSNPCAVVSPDGIIHCVWQGTDSTDTSQHNIRYSKSIDDGLTWSTMLKLTTGNTYYQNSPSITADKNNNIYVLWNGYHSGSASYQQIRKLVYSNTVWGTISNLTTAANDCNKVATCTNYTDFTDPLCIYQDGSSIRFRGVWTESEYVSVLVEDARYNITPKTGSSGETVSWIDYEHDDGFSVDSKTSIVGSTDDESYLTMNKTVTAIDENVDEAQFELNTTPNSKITQRITLTRDSVNVDKGILQYIGALG